MSFVAIPAVLVAAGAVAIAALLFALQRLRARPRVVRLANAMLWAAAAGSAPRRVLVERFSRWPSYLLLLGIALLLWLAVARPEFDAAPDGRLHLFYLDASAPMLAGTRFADARQAMLADAAAIPRGDRAVTLGTAFPVRLLGRGEDSALMQGRLAEARPDAAPSAFAAWLARVPGQAGGRGVTVHYYGADPAAAASPPAGVRLVAGYRAPPLAANRGIVALGSAPARSGSGATDVLVRAVDTRGRGIAASDLAITIDGRRFVPASVEARAPDGWLLREVPATGGVLRVALSGGDGFAADDTAAIVLPDRRPVRVAVAPGVPAAIRAVAALDPAVRLVPVAAAQVVVRRAGQRFGDGVPALTLSDATTGAPAFAVTDPVGADRATLARDLDESGVTRIDAARLAEGSGRPVGAVIAAGPRRGLAVWSQLFAADAGFADAPAMPLLVSRSLRWLSRPAATIPYAQAGAALPDQTPLYGLGGDAGLAAAALNGTLIAGTAGVAGTAGERQFGGQRVIVSLDSAAISRAVAAPVRGETGATPWRSLPDLILPVLLVAAGLLLAVEWWLLTRRRIP